MHFLVLAPLHNYASSRMTSSLYDFKSQTSSLEKVGSVNCMCKVLVLNNLANTLSLLKIDSATIDLPDLFIIRLCRNELFLTEQCHNWMLVFLDF